MHFLIDDLQGLILGVLAMVPLWLLPGFGLARLAAVAGFSPARDRDGAVWAILFAVILLPALDALLVRAFGLAPAIGLHLLLAVAGAQGATYALRQVARPFYAMAFLWFLVCAFVYVDVDLNDRLNQSLIILDLVKHSAVITSISHYGLPLVDPFVARSGPAGYYHYYYLVGAMVDRVGGGCIDGRMAFAASAFWTGIALPIALWWTAKAIGLVHDGRSIRFLGLSIAACFIMGLDLPAMLAKLSVGAPFEGQADWWGEEIGFGMIATQWVPHHLSACMATIISAILMQHAVDTEGRERIASAVAAGVALASVAGLSIWVALGAMPILGFWVLTAQGHMLQRIAIIAAAGALAMVLFAPQAIDILYGRADEGFPLGLWIRPFARLIWYSPSANFVINASLLPFGWLLQFGIFALGTGAFLARSTLRELRRTPLGWFMIVSFVVGLLLASFVRSIIINNDFGWRVAWFVQWPAMIWTIAILQDASSLRTLRPIWLICLVIGLAGTAWNLAGFRWLRPPLLATSWPFINADSSLSLARRKAYAWARRTLPPDAVIQHNPAAHRRAFDFGLYDMHRVWVADREANLFGASRQMVGQRLKAIAPVFDPTIPFPIMARRFVTKAIDYLVISDEDPVWAFRRDRFGPCIYENNRVCIVSTKFLLENTK